MHIHSISVIGNNIKRKQRYSIEKESVYIFLIVQMFNLEKWKTALNF